MPHWVELLTASFGWRDFVALATFIGVMQAMTVIIERDGAARPSVARMMARHRARWMACMVRRELRIADAALLTLQHRGAAFFASACMIAIGGVVALIGNTDLLVAVAGDITPEAAAQDKGVWELKLLFLLCVIALAFHRFVWAHRLFSYCAILFGAAPDNAPEEAQRRAAQTAARVNLRAGRSFNRGLRLIYFALAALAWLMGPEAFLLATLLTAAMIYWREFWSDTRQALADELAGDRDA